MSSLLSNDIQDGGLTVLVNLTPHDVLVIDGEKIIQIEKSGEIARVSSSSEKVGTAAGLPLFATKFGEVANLPEPKKGNLYIVSALVRAALPHRKDLLSPSQLVRNSEGAVIGCQGFDVNP